MPHYSTFHNPPVWQPLYGQFSRRSPATVQSHQHQHHHQQPYQTAVPVHFSSSSPWRVTGGGRWEEEVRRDERRRLRRQEEYRRRLQLQDERRGAWGIGPGGVRPYDCPRSFGNGYR